MSGVPTDLTAIRRELSRPVGSLQEMPQRVELCRQALSMVDKLENAKLWGALNGKLAYSLFQNPLGSRAKNLEEAIARYGKALEVYTRQEYPELWGMTLNSLAAAWGERILGKRAENLEKAIAYLNQALEVLTLQEYPERWALTQHNLANAYRSRIRGERAENLELAIEHYQQALLVRTWFSNPEDWAFTQVNLGVAYGERIRGERADNLEMAIELYQQALQVSTNQAYPEQWATTHNNLALAYCDRIRGDRAKNLEDAIAHGELALNVYTRQDYPERWAMAQNNLANAYRSRIRGERMENLEQAVACYKQALEVYTRQAFPEEWAGTQNNLATVYRIRGRGERAENLEQAIHCYEQALEVYTRQAFPEDWAWTQVLLANVYRDRIFGQQETNLNQAIAHYEQAVEVYTPQTFPRRFQLVKRNLGDIYFDEKQWTEALTTYQQAIGVEKSLLETAYTEAGRRTEVAQTGMLYASATYALLKLERACEALALLDQGKTRLLSQALALNEVDLSYLPVEQQRTLRDLRKTLRSIESEIRLPDKQSARHDERALAASLARTRGRLTQAIAQIRQSHPDFLPDGLKVSDILGLIPQHAALVAPVVTSQGSAVFVIPEEKQSITSDQILWLDDFKAATLQSLLRGPTEEEQQGGWLGVYHDAHMESKSWLDTIEYTGQVLWEHLMGPIAERLSFLDVQQVLLMPQGGLGLLPMHAAWHESAGVRRYFLDEYVVSYVYSAYVQNVIEDRLRDAQRGGRTLFAVVNPTDDLPFTPAEGVQVARLFGENNASVVLGSQATPEAVRTAKAGYLHFACHGFYNWQNPMQSGLILATGEPFTLAQIIGQLDLMSTRLITLSACETGITDIRQSPDEFLGLPTGFLQAGAQAVVTTLWAVNDLSTPLLMERFYQLHLNEEFTISDALGQAQTWIRDVTAGELTKRFEEEEEAALLGRGRMPIETASTYFASFAALESNHRPFAHPYYWAAFAFSGA